MTQILKFPEGPEEYQGTFAVYRKSDGRCVVYGEGEGEMPDLVALLHDALWANLEGPIAVVSVSEKETRVDLDQTDHTEQEALEILLATLEKRLAEFRKQ